MLIAGSPGIPSRVATAADHVAWRLQEQGATTATFDVNAFDPAALLYADTESPAIRQYLARVAEADAIVIATPVYQSSFSGVLKLLLDPIPQNGLRNKIALPIASGGSPNHLLVLDYALTPVLSALGADSILNGVYVTSSELSRTETGYRIGEAIRARLDDAATELHTRLVGVANAATPASTYRGARDAATLIRRAAG
ncbi:NADPH-dependent FMN reductase [Salinisphaera sp. Q1T1-3]|uniref:NADPH-dependent FMN reductase n=1 Tax=Salinisphaera sp. Q1T1-3 TaxID=2321229 RepID=UPI001F26F596|nr:NADPH-dependent FMN reductase [Salinisphaera sp. Q1T1-3]